LSLLLDALKRAEQEKRARGGQAEGAPPILPAREPPAPRPAPAALSSPGDPRRTPHL